MGLLGKLKGELIDIIEWIDEDRDVMVHCFERHGNEIKMGAKLIVRVSQCAVFVNEGKIADVFKPGAYSLETKNMPILSTMRNWYRGFHSPFKAEIYFINTRQFIDLKWGTSNPVILRDREFGPLRVRAFGTYCIKVHDPSQFIKQIVGTNKEFDTDNIEDQLRSIIVGRFSDLLSESKIPVVDIAASYDELAGLLFDKLIPDFREYGIELTKFIVQNISLPPEVTDALDKRSQMQMLGNLNDYSQFQAANAMENASLNPNGGGSEGMGLGMGFAMGQQMVDMMSRSKNNAQSQSQAQTMGPPPLPKQDAIYYTGINGQQAGPLSLDQIKAQIQSGVLTPDTLMWKQGMAQWDKASKITEIMPIFNSPPPPLPKD